MTAKLAWSCDATSVRSAPVQAARPASSLGQRHHLVRQPSSPALRAAYAQPLSVPTVSTRSLRPSLQLTTPVSSLARRASVTRGASLERAKPDQQAARAPLDSPARAPSLSRRPPSPASSPSTTSSPSPTLYRPPHARLSPSRPSANASWTNASRSPSPTLNRTPRLQSPLLEVHGDSFCGVFTLLGSECTVRRYSGASARGLNNPQSKQQVSQRLLDRLETARPHSVLLMFGAVDFAVNYLWQLKARGPEAVGPDDWTKKVICDYTAFLSDRIVPLARKCGTRLYVAGVLPPVVEDCYLEATADKYISISSTSAGLLPLAETAHPHDLATRMAMTRRYNSMLASYCSRFPDCFAFVDIGRDLVDRRDPLCHVAPEFLDPEDATNIHLLWETTLPFWMRALPPLAPLASRMSTAPELTRLGQSLAQYNQEKRERVRSRRSSWEHARPGTARGHGLS